MMYGKQSAWAGLLVLLLAGWTLQGQSPAQRPQGKKAGKSVPAAVPDVVVHFVVLGVT